MSGPALKTSRPAELRRQRRKDRPLDVAVRPPSPYRLPRYGGQDGTVRIRDGVAARYFEIERAPILVRAWQEAPDRVVFRAQPVTPSSPTWAEPGRKGRGRDRVAPLQVADREQLERAIARLRFALAVDDDLTDFFAAFKGDRLLGPLIRRRPHLRPLRNSSPWEALICAIAGQLIEAERAAAISRRIVRRWGAAGPGTLRDAPAPAVLAGCAPAELQAMDLAAGRAAAMRRVAAEVAAGRVDLADPGSAARLASRPQIGPWTLQCVALLGRGEADALPAGDLDYIKLVGRLAGLGRRAEIEEVEQFYAPYVPYRGLAGTFTRHCLRGRIAI